MGGFPDKQVEGFLYDWNFDIFVLRTTGLSLAARQKGVQGLKIEELFVHQDQILGRKRV